MSDADGMRAWMRERMRLWEENTRREAAAGGNGLAGATAPAAARGERSRRGDRHRQGERRPDRRREGRPGLGGPRHRDKRRQNGGAGDGSPGSTTGGGFDLAVVYLRGPGRGTFAPGNRGGPGRPRDARDRLSAGFVAGLAAEFAAHGAEAIRQVRLDDPVAFLHLVFRVVLPGLRDARSEPEPSLLSRFSVAELVELRRQLEEAVALARAGVPIAEPPILAAKAAAMDADGEGGEDPPPAA